MLLDRPASVGGGLTPLTVALAPVPVALADPSCAVSGRKR
jgi:hypothetical protein